MLRELLFSGPEGDLPARGGECAAAWFAVIEDGECVELSIESIPDAHGGSGAQLPTVGDVHLGIVRTIVSTIQSSFVEIAGGHPAFIRDEDLLPNASWHEGQRVIVQVTKPAIGAKGARGTEQILIPGRFLVITPGVMHIGLSRRLENETERERLSGIATRLAGENYGFIVRTAAEGADEKELAADARSLASAWDAVRAAAARAKGATVLRTEEDLLGRMLRDLAVAGSVGAIVVEGREAYRRSAEFLERFAPPLLPALSLHSGKSSLFEFRRMSTVLDRATSPRLTLPSGGTIVIAQTEAMVAIDVNTGRGSAGHSILDTNLEAAREIARQLRLRDLGGLIVADFIDMEDEPGRTKIMEALALELTRDRVPASFLAMSDYGLVQITRRRRRHSLERTLLDECAACHGTGRVRSRARLSGDERGGTPGHEGESGRAG